MLKEFVQYLLDLKRPQIVETEGNTYSTRQLNRLNVEAIQVRSLSGLVDYVRSNFEHDRRTYVEARALLPEITFERYMSREKFNVMLQACFVKNADKERVLKVISSIIEENSVTQNDDGVTQRVTAKTGVATKWYRIQ